MNFNNFCLNDTLDFVTFSEDINLSNNLKDTKGILITTLNENLDVLNDCDLSENENISVDDSAFLNEFSLSCEINSSSDNRDTTTLNNDILPRELSACSSIRNSCNGGHATLELSSSNDLNNRTNELRTENIQSGENILESTPLINNEVEIKTESLSTNKCDNLALSAWNLPDVILQKYRNLGVSFMFPWQAQCLNNMSVLGNNANLIYSAPTSAGKTLVAEILLIKTILERRKKVIFILPFISVVREKMFYFQNILGSSGIRVEGFMGCHNPPGGFHTIQVAICTIEKANSIINKLLEEGTLSDIGGVIVDEIHLLGDSSRGYLLELMLTKILYMSTRYDDINIQIIGMSATLPNLDLLGKWLKAELYVTNFRPIPLHEQCLIDNKIYNKNFSLERQLSNFSELETDTDHILQLCIETIENSCSVLIFCPTKNWCESLAEQIALAFWKLGCSKSSLGLILRQQLNPELITEVLEQLKRCPVGLDTILQRTVSYAVAFHHAGLTMDERDIIEGAFRNGALRVLVATSTLSSGVNLPARRVLIRTPIFHGKPLNHLVYRQMIGRAGRMGKDSCGESILICQKNESRFANELLSTELQPIQSCLEGDGRLKRAILEVIASGVAETPEDVNLFTNCTLLAVNESNSDDVLFNPIQEAVDYLLKNEFIRLQNTEAGNSKYIPTPFGRACLCSSMPPEEGLALFSEVEKARQCFVLESELHVIYLVTPYSVCNQWTNFDWMLFLELWEKLPSSMKKVGELVGVQESYIVSGTRNKILTGSSKLYHKLQIHRRFFTALALQDLVNEVPLNDVATKYGCTRGMLQSLQQSASTFAGMLTIFCRQLGWSSVEILISQFQDRLQFGVNRDLLDLMRLSILNGPRARALYNVGIETLAHLASSDVCAVENALRKIAPFESKKEREGESKFAAQKRNEVRTIWMTGKAGLTEREAAEMLITDARRYLQLELGLCEAKWKNSKEETLTQNATEHSITNKVDSETTTTTIEKEINQHEQNSIHKNNLTNPSNEIANSNCSYKSSISSQNISTSHNVYNKSLDIVTDIPNPKKSSTEKDILSTSDQSLFEQSFELEEQFTKCVISQETHIDNKAANIETTNSNQHISENSDSGLDFDIFDSAAVSNSNKKSKTAKTNTAIGAKPKVFDCKPNQTSPKTSEDLVINSQDNSELSSQSSVFIKSYRKRDRNSKENIVTSTNKSLGQIPSKRRKTNTSEKRSNNSGSALDSKVGAGLNSFHSAKNSDPADLTELHIIDVCGDKKLYKTFCTELFKQRIVSLSLACTKVQNDKPVIGRNILQNSEGNQTVSLKGFANKNRQIVGIVLSWDVNIAYYVSFDNPIISNSIKLEMLRKLFHDKLLTVRIYDCKEQIKTLKTCCNLSFGCIAEDPKVADWLMEPDDAEKHLQALAVKYAPEAINLSQLTGHCKGTGSVGLDLNSSIKPQVRAAVEAIVTWQLCESLNDLLVEYGEKLLETYKLEMRSILCLVTMECNGIGVDFNALQTLADDLKEQVRNLEKEAYVLAGRRFSFTSSTDVAKVLGMYKGRKISTSKRILEKQERPVADLILQWRKISNTLTKMVYPLIQMVDHDRIYSCCITHNSTGRISMHEPNLQNVPKDFEVLKKSISCRSVFVAGKNNIYVSADYCQLELRILAHLSQDQLLCSIMKSGEDVFRSVAAKWKNINEIEVNDIQRQWAKQICYGIIYGMGSKTLSEQLSISEEDAAQFMESFRNCYPNLKTYIQETINKCRDLGYVETLASRRRYLPNINHQNAVLKGQAERQAVNTTVQGSAADITKLAMVAIDTRLQEKFRHSSNMPKLILHLHDELLYEVQEKYLIKTAKIIRRCMEDVVKLSVPFPVKLKSGSSWGNMKELVI